MRYQTLWPPPSAASAAAGIVIAAATGLAACGGSDQGDATVAVMRVSIDPPVLVARHNESVTLRVDVPDVAEADLPSGYAFDLDEVVGKIDVSTAPCPAGAGSIACQDWTVTPRSGSVPGRYDVAVRTSGSRAATGHGSFALTVIAAPSPAFGAAVVAVAGSNGHVLVRNDAGRVFALGSNDRAQTHAGYRRLPVPGIDFRRDYGTAILEPGLVTEFVEAPLPEGRWIAIDAVSGRSYAVRDDGSVWAWGSNELGAFGFAPVGDSPFETSARPLPSLAGVRALSAGQAPRNPSYALLADGSVWFWQADILPLAPACEEYADGRREECRRNFSGVQAMARSDRSSWNVSPDWPDGRGFDFFLKSDGSVWDAAPGPGRLDGTPSPATAIAIDADANLIAVGADGSVWLRQPNRNPVQVAGLSDVVAASARPRSGGEVFALRRDGTVWAWIVGAPAPADTPQPIAGLANVVSLGGHYAITGDCIVGGALWRIDRGGFAQAPKAVRVPGFGEGSGCTPPPTIETAIGVRGQGRLISAPGGIDCASSCVARFAQAGELLLHAAPAAGWRFSHWEGDEDCASAIVPTRDIACTVVFVEGGERRLSVRIDGSGTVASDPPGIDCGDDCTQSYALDTAVTLAATPAPGYSFEAFVGDDDCADGTLTTDRVKSCVALFKPLAAPPAPSGFAASVLGSAVQLRWDAGGTVVERYSLERADASGVFVPFADTIRGFDTGYIDHSSAANTSYTYRLSAINSRGTSPPVTVTVTTGSEASPTLEVSIAGTGNGRVISVPGGIDCGSDCSESLMPGTTVTLFADGNFQRWEACDTVNGNRCIVTMNGPRRVGATFDATAAPRYLLSVVRQGAGAVVSTPPGIECGLVCVADFAAGTVVTLSGSAQFAGANGCDQIVGNQCTVTMDRSRGVVFGGIGVAAAGAVHAQGGRRSRRRLHRHDRRFDRLRSDGGTCLAHYAAGPSVDAYASWRCDEAKRMMRATMQTAGLDLAPSQSVQAVSSTARLRVNVALPAE